MKQFRLVDNIVGWIAFAIAAFVYCSTIEPTASFWDCPEFIDTGYKLQIGHPPGAPFFMLTANLFSHFASDPSQVAYWVNTMSALLSAACILFLFWSITHMVRRLLTDSYSEITPAKLIAIEASGLVGALIYTFSDTFWFSAVEGEVYAYSSAFTALVFWLILKWEDNADQPHSDRWLVLIMYMTGLSIGVHLLNLLCLPAIVLVYYYKRFPNANLKGSIIALLISFVLVAVVLYGVIPGVVTVGGWFELLFVNLLGMPFNTGLYVYLLLLAGSVVWAVYETQQATDDNFKRQNIAFLLSVGLIGVPFYGYGWSAALIGIVVLAALWYVLNRKVKLQGAKQAVALVSSRFKNTAMLCMLMLLVGYSTYAVIVIRSDANTPMDQNSPEDIFTLGEYMGREQYGSRPLFYGQAYTSQLKRDASGYASVKHGKPRYMRKEKASADEKDRYFIVGTKDEYEYTPNMLFPRMYSQSRNPDHVGAYESWMGGIEGRQVAVDSRGEVQYVKMPTQFENLKFFFSYQCNWMYWRYFMWNFAGRQNDVQGHGELEHGNWITGIKALDDLRLGNQDLLPDELKNNKGHNVFYCLPLLLGLLGLFWQSLARGQKGIQQFWVVFFLFFMTGLAIVVYLNQTPLQPRERDYAYAGSFYAFAIWCGMGVAAIIDTIEKYLNKSHVAVSAIVGLAALAVPVQMASQTWDDHDRSDRYTCRDFGQNYLMSLQQQGNPIIFTNGDNDTFPLWYNQDVEGVRTDARVCNLSYLQTDWYIDQMIRPAYDSPSLPITWKRLQYVEGTNDFVAIYPEGKNDIRVLYEEYPDDMRRLFGDEPFELSNVLKIWVKHDVTPQQLEAMKIMSPFQGHETHYIPSDTLYVTIDKEAVRRSGMLLQSDSIPDKMVISLKGRGSLSKSDLMMLEMIAHANWERPLYVAQTVGQDNFMNLGDNFVQEGLANRITPFTTNIEGHPLPGMTDFDIDKTYDRVVNHFRFGGVSTPGIYLDETVMRMCYTHRRLLSDLALRLAATDDKQRAAKVLSLAEKELPYSNVPVEYQAGELSIIEAYAKIEQTDKATEHLLMLWEKSRQYLNWYMSLGSTQLPSYQRECKIHFWLLNDMCFRLAPIISDELYEKLGAEWDSLVKRYHDLGGKLQ